MFIEYCYWHYVQAPLWLLRFYTTVQRALLQFFSVPLMLRTLISPWHKDQVRYKPGGLSSIFMIWSWNVISRGIGCIIRSAVLIVWIFSEIVVVIFSSFFFIIFLLWPLAALISLIMGLGLVLYSV